MFSPLFTLLTSTSHSSNQQTIHHPTVRYIFEDDDPEILTAELAQHHRDHPSEAEDTDINNGGTDRAIILDMEHTADGSGFEVVWAGSLSPDWAVTSANLSTMEGGVGGSGGGLVLKIEGVSLDSSSGTAAMGRTQSPDTELHSSEASTGRQQPNHGQSNTEEYNSLLQDFERRMAVLRKVTEAGAERQKLLREQEAMAAEASAAHFLQRPGGAQDVRQQL